MSIEKNWRYKEYANDIHQHLRHKEKKRFFYFERSYQLRMRKSLVVWMTDLSDEFGFCICVKHLAVYLLDIFLDNHYCLPHHLKMVASCCLILAVKVEDNLAPLNSSFNTVLGKQYKLKEFVKMEMNILSFFNWDVLNPTAAHFLEYYSLYALDPSDSTEGEPAYDFERIKVYAQKYMEYFLNITLLDVAFYKFPSSLVAAACILATRSCLCLCPPWPVSLQQTTWYKFGQVQPCMDLMLRTLNTQAVQKITTQVCDSSSIDSSTSPSICVLQS